MKRLRFIVCGTLSIVVGFVVASNAGQATPPRPPDPAAVRSNRAAEYRAPEGIDFRTARITSEGVQLHAELFSPTALAGKPLPTIIMAHGWGGTAAVFRRDAVDQFAARATRAAMSSTSRHMIAASKPQSVRSERSTRAG